MQTYTEKQFPILTAHPTQALNARCGKASVFTERAARRILPLKNCRAADKRRNNFYAPQTPPPAQIPAPPCTYDCTTSFAPLPEKQRTKSSGAAILPPYSE